METDALLKGTDLKLVSLIIIHVKKCASLPVVTKLKSLIFRRRRQLADLIREEEDEEMSE